MKPIRHSLLAASILAAFLVPAAPAAFALGTGTTYGGIYTAPGGTPDAPAARYTQQIMQKTVASRDVSADAGTTYRGINLEPRGTPDAPAARYSQEVLQKKVVPSSHTSIAVGLPGVPAY